MTVQQKTIWERFLAPVFNFLIDGEELERYSKSVDWEAESEQFRRGDVEIPLYYSSKNFHGVKRGYLNSGAAVSYDAITQYVTPPNENWVRQELINGIALPQPRRILDLGCGTGSTTLMLKEAFPEAEVIGLDLSPYMLVRASHKAAESKADIIWRHGNVERTSFEEASFDLVTATLLFHETPVKISKTILHEAFRLLVPGGQMLVLDGNQKRLREQTWLSDIFEEPYIQEYGNSSVDGIMGAAGFEEVRTKDVWLVHQLTSGVKPIPVRNTATSHNAIAQNPVFTDPIVDDNDIGGYPSPTV
ncbi:MAG: methyltransferase domain-containing protein [Cyanobacteria bacterium P01_A01_bin.84]